MKNRHPMLRALIVPFIALFVAACGGTTEVPDLEPDQALVRVENDVVNAPYVTISMEDMAGNTVPLGNVDRDTAENLVFLVSEFEDDLRLVATKPGDDSRDDHIISRTFVASGGMTVNWYLPENTLEVDD